MKVGFLSYVVLDNKLFAKRFLALAYLQCFAFIVLRSLQTKLWVLQHEFTNKINEHLKITNTQR